MKKKKKIESGICTNYVPVKAGAQAGSFGFQKSQARPNTRARLCLAWLGLSLGAKNSK
jgi:hypothetical protein